MANTIDDAMEPGFRHLQEIFTEDSDGLSQVSRTHPY